MAPSQRKKAEKAVLETLRRRISGRGGAIPKRVVTRAQREEAFMEGVRRKSGSNPRGAIVSKVMREQGLSLPAASKYVKDNGLY